MKISYNFRLGPEALWLILNTVVATALLQIVGTDFQQITDLGTWATGFGIGLLSRTIPAAIIAAASGGFYTPGQPSAQMVEAARTGDATPDGPEDLEAPYFPEG